MQTMRSSAVFLRVPADSDPVLKTSLSPRSSVSTYPSLSGPSASITARASDSSEKSMMSSRVIVISSLLVEDEGCDRLPDL